VIRLVGVVAVLAAHARGAPREHRVAEGQTLGAIAQRYGVTTEELAAANEMSESDVLAIGRRLVIPDPAPRTRPNAPPSEAAE